MGGTLRLHADGCCAETLGQRDIWLKSVSQAAAHTPNGVSRKVAVPPGMAIDTHEATAYIPQPHELSSSLPQLFEVADPPVDTTDGELAAQLFSTGYHTQGRDRIKPGVRRALDDGGRQFEVTRARPRGSRSAKADTDGSNLPSHSTFAPSLRVV